MDCIRIISALGVFFIHYIAILSSRFSISNYLLSQIQYCLGISVPLFFITSGYCIFNKKRSYKYVSKKIIEFWLLFVLTNALCLFCNEIYMTSLNNALSKIAFFIIESLKFNFVSHLWFMPCIICIYLFVPIFTSLDDDNLYTFTFLTLIFVIFKNHIPVLNKINFSIPLPYYFSYFLCGGLIQKNLFDIKIIILALVTNIFAIIFKINNAGYHSASFFFISITIFKILLSKKIVKVSFDIRRIGSLTFFVYLFHPFFIHFLFDVLKINTFKNNNYVSFVFVGMLLFILTFLFSFALQFAKTKLKELMLNKL
ncbi:MAG: acyltransferase [Eubacteriales bacterium]|nr:acyltransferase [Eubacteriales bacterium]